MPANSLLLILVAILNAVVGVLAYARSSRQHGAIYFALLFISVSSWALLLFLRSLLTSSTDAFFVTRFIYLSVVFLNLCFLLFVTSFPNRLSSLIGIWLARTMETLGVILALLLLGSRWILSDFVFQGYGIGVVQFGKFAPVFNIFIPVSFVCGLYILALQYREQSNDIERKQILFIVLGAVATLIGGVATNLVLPAFGNFQWNWLGPGFTFALVVSIAYAIVQHRLWDVRVIATEIFGFLIAFIALFELLNASSWAERGLRIFIFFAIIVFVVLLIRSVWREVRAREEIERLAKELEFANKELKRLDQAKSDFISIASHQLRTPLSIVKGYISMIREGSYGDISENVRKTLNKIYLSNERLIKLVADLLDLSRMESGKLQYEFAEFNIVDIVDSTVDEFRIPAEDRNIDLIWNKPQESFVIWGDSWKLRQVIFNLIDNGLKYTEKGSLMITLQKASNIVTLSVKDTGVGMTPEIAHGLFQKFTRGKDSFKTNAQGLGLGLFIAKKIVDDHQGKLWAESGGEGKGSIFIMEFPTASAIKQKKDFISLVENM